MGWTIRIHATVTSSYDNAEDIAAALEKLAQKLGCADTMVEVIEQGKP